MHPELKKYFMRSDKLREEVLQKSLERARKGKGLFGLGKEVTMSKKYSKGFWDYCCESPFLAFFLAWAMIEGIVDIVAVVVSHIK